jgi:hypothetical protein
VDIVAPGAYVLAKVDGGMHPNTWNADQLRKYYAWCTWLIKDTVFSILHLSAYLIWSISKLGMSDLVTQTEGALQPNNKNDKSQKRDNTFLIWSDASP